MKKKVYLIVILLITIVGFGVYFANSRIYTIQELVDQLCLELNNPSKRNGKYDVYSKRVIDGNLSLDALIQMCTMEGKEKVYENNNLQYTKVELDNTLSDSKNLFWEFFWLDLYTPNNQRYDLLSSDEVVLLHREIFLTIKESERTLYATYSEYCFNDNPRKKFIVCDVVSKINDTFTFYSTIKKGYVKYSYDEGYARYHFDNDYNDWKE